MDTFLVLVTEPFKNLYSRFLSFLPNLLALATILLLGLAAGLLLRLALLKVLTLLKFDAWCDRMGFTSLLRRGNFWKKPSDALASVTFLTFLVATLLLALSMLKIPAITLLVTNAVHYVPRAFSAVLILSIGYLVTGVLSRAVLIAAVNSGSRYASLLAEAVRLLLTVLFLAMALEQLRMAPSIVTAAFSIIFGGIVLALAIAFGVGGIQAARRVIELEAENKHPESGDTEHL